jgi:hypothetical protein
MLTSSPVDSPDLPSRSKLKSNPTIATPTTSQALNKSHRLLRPLKSKLLSLQQFHESNPSLIRVDTILSTQIWPPTTRNTTKFYGGKRKRTRNNTGDSDDKTVWEEVQFADIDALKFAKNSATSVSIANMFTTLHSSYRIFCQQLRLGCSLESLGGIATYTLGTWTYLYERQSNVQPYADSTTTTDGDPIITLDDVLLEYLPPTHPHLPLLLGYTIALFCDYVEFIRPLLPSLILLTHSVSRRATIELVHCMFSVAGSGWEDFSLCMTISRLIEREDEYLHWLSQNMTVSFITDGGLGHLLRLNREYPSFAATIVRAVCLSVPQKRRSLDPDLESILSDLIQLVCTYSLQSTSTKHLIQLASILPPQRTPLPSLSLLIHLTIRTNLPNYPDTYLLPLLKRDLSFAILRRVLLPETLKSQISSLLRSTELSPLAISIARDWKDHINYDDEPEDLETIQEFLDRIEREYLSETEGVIWRFEDVLEEWIGEWPDGKEIGSTKIPRVRRCIPMEEEDEEEEDDDDDEFAGSLVKRFVPRSGLIVETPIQSRGMEFMSERKGVLDRLFKLTNIGQTVKNTRIQSTYSEESDGGSFLDRLGHRKIQSGRKNVDGQDTNGDEIEHNNRVRKRTITSDDETSIYKDSDPERKVVETARRKERKRRRFEDSDNDSDRSVYEDSDLENHSVQSNSDLEPSTSDIDELSIEIENPRFALRGIPINQNPTRPRTSSTSRTVGKMLVRESSPIFYDDASDDELAI